MFLARKFCWTKTFILQEFFWTEISLGPNILLNPRKNYRPKIFPNPKYFGQKISFWPKISLEAKFFSNPNIVGITIFLYQNFLRTKNFIGPNIFFRSKIYFKPTKKNWIQNLIKKNFWEPIFLGLGDFH